jgi:hypothetical protein
MVRPGPRTYAVLFESFIHQSPKNLVNKIEALIHEPCYGRQVEYGGELCTPVYYADPVCTRAKINWTQKQQRNSPADTPGGEGKASEEGLF